MLDSLSIVLDPFKGVSLKKNFTNYTTTQHQLQTETKIEN